MPKAAFSPKMEDNEFEKVALTEVDTQPFVDKEIVGDAEDLANTIMASAVAKMRIDLDKAYERHKQSIVSGLDEVYERHKQNIASGLDEVLAARQAKLGHCPCCAQEKAAAAQKTGGTGDSSETKPSVESDVKEKDAGNALPPISEIPIPQGSNETGSGAATTPRTDETSGRQKANPKSPRRLKRTKTNDSSQYQGIRKRLFSLLTAKEFEGFVVIAIIGNAFLIGVSVQMFADERKSSDNAQEPFIVALEVLFLIFFLFELACRVYVNRMDFFVGEECSWNFFDSLVVFISLVDRVLETIVNTKIPSQLSVLRILRIVRVIRMLRIIRVMRFFRDLRLMVMSILSSAKSLLWVAVILFLVFYVFGIGLTQGTVDYLSLNGKWESEDTSYLRKYFSSLDRSLLSLLEAMIGGISWGEHVEVLKPLPWVFTAIFLVFIVFSILAVLNIVTAVFVDCAMESAEQSKEIQAADKQHERQLLYAELTDIFLEIDSNGNGMLSLEELDAAFTEDEVKERFQRLDIGPSDTRTLFEMLDSDGEGAVTVEEFIDGCQKIKGPVNSLDFATMLYQVKWMKKTISAMIQGHPEKSQATPRTESTPLVTPRRSPRKIPDVFL